PPKPSQHKNNFARTAAAMVAAFSPQLSRLPYPSQSIPSTTCVSPGDLLLPIRPPLSPSARSLRRHPHPPSSATGNPTRRHHHNPHRCSRKALRETHCGKHQDLGGLFFDLYTVLIEQATFLFLDAHV
ncbi:hypothetical protein Taro_017710, partial [Colocasia esculenta]|nr:hypothetical protein [Colocasia esculenta]